MLDVSTLIENGITGFNVTMTFADLQAMGDRIVQQIMSKVVPAVADNAEERLMTKREVMEKLGVCHTTLWNWERKLLLTPVKIGRKVHYRVADVEALLRQTQNRHHRL